MDPPPEAYAGVGHGREYTMGAAGGQFRGAECCFGGVSPPPPLPFPSSRGSAPSTPPGAPPPGPLRGGCAPCTPAQGLRPMHPRKNVRGLCPPGTPWGSAPGPAGAPPPAPLHGGCAPCTPARGLRPLHPRKNVRGSAPPGTPWGSAPGPAGAPAPRPEGALPPSPPEGRGTWGAMAGAGVSWLGARFPAPLMGRVPHRSRAEPPAPSVRSCAEWVPGRPGPLPWPCRARRGGRPPGR